MGSPSTGIARTPSRTASYATPFSAGRMRLARLTLSAALALRRHHARHMATGLDETGDAAAQPDGGAALTRCPQQEPDHDRYINIPLGWVIGDLLDVVRRCQIRLQCVQLGPRHQIRVVASFLQAANLAAQPLRLRIPLQIADKVQPATVSQLAPQ